MSNFVDVLKKMSDAELLEYIRSELMRNGERLRFEMSGYDGVEGRRYDDETPPVVSGSCTLHNQKVLNTFAHLGIYDYTEFMVLDFYKGCGTFYWGYWGSDEVRQKQLGGYSTSEIIREIFKLTILSGGPARRRV